ncbi:HAD-like domain-containing protein [Lentinula lateritia]|uniref:HAD-like domain-containing protein n=1 Tax=Lentinula lateritia TaxID=40482 RepID=A0ABQ8VFE2_9AGAR|nr:HAD-like domain-containing protein [Lentinula lateritia]
MTARLTDFKVLVFDVYGTLADWETGIFLGLKPMLSRYSTSSGWSRKQVLEAFSAVESDLQAKYPHLLYSDLLAKVHEVMEERLKAGSGRPPETSISVLVDEHVEFGQSIKDWPIFPDSYTALHTLSKHYKLVVLSNVDRTSFAHTLAKLSEEDSTDFSPETYSPPESEEYWYPQRNPKSKSPFTLVLTAQDVQSYKPALHGFEVALDVIHREATLLNTPKDQVLWVAQSLFHDIEPVSRLGVTSVFINREGATMGFRTGPEPIHAWQFVSLGKMAEAVSKV